MEKVVIYHNKELPSPSTHPSLREQTMITGVVGASFYTYHPLGHDDKTAWAVMTNRLRTRPKYVRELTLLYTISTG